jgi:ribosomal protein L40E
VSLVTAPNACPACGAALRPDAPWCTLCYADLRPKPPEPEPQPEPQPEPVVQAPAPDPLTDPLPDLLAPALSTPTIEGPTWPCTTCGGVNPMDRDTCASCGAGFLAAAKDESPLLELPVVGDITRLGRGQRFALAGGVVLAFVLLTLLIGVLLG